jgi:2',3'-cyclic-nucleotide 2'-phosphodiesterase
MCGVQDSVIGFKRENIVQKFLSGRPTRIEVAKGKAMANGVICKIDTKSKAAESIKRFQMTYQT